MKKQNILRLSIIAALTISSIMFAEEQNKKIFINSLKRGGGFASVADVKKNVSSTDLDDIYAIMKESRPNLGLLKCIQTMAYLSEKGDKRAVETIITYFKGNDSDILENKNLLKNNSREYLETCIISQKAYMLECLGIVGGHEAVSFLKEMLDENNVEKLYTENFPYPDSKIGSKEEIITFIQGRAATGLVISQDKNGIALVKSLYSQAAAEQASGKQTPLFKNLIDAMVYSDLIDEIGFEDTLLMYGSLSDITPFMEKYFDKYSLKPTINRNAQFSSIEILNLEARVRWFRLTPEQSKTAQMSKYSKDACLETIYDPNIPKECRDWAILNMFKLCYKSDDIVNAVKYADLWLTSNPNHKETLSVKYLKTELLAGKVNDFNSVEYQEFVSACNDIFQKYELDNMPVIQCHLLAAKTIKAVNGPQDIIDEQIDKAKNGCQSLISLLEPKPDMPDYPKERFLRIYTPNKNKALEVLNQIDSQNIQRIGK
ncbi:MAG: hypothetical protein NTW93_07980 [Phycisphaerae bacterium]|nr:hypothetical protein [Phycisphaerae bacterium]